MENEAKIERKLWSNPVGICQTHIDRCVQLLETSDRKTTCQRLTYQQNRRRLGRIERMAMYG